MTRETDGGARVNCPEVTVWFILPDRMRTVEAGPSLELELRRRKH